MKMSSRYLGVFGLVSAVVFAVGCTALGDRDEESPPQKRGPSAIEIPLPMAPADPNQGEYPPNCITDYCREAWDRMRDRLSPQAVPPAVSAASAAKGGCKTAQPKPVPKKKEAKSCGSTTAALPAPAASAPAIVSAPVPVTSAASAPAFKLADPVTERRTSMVGSYDWVWDRFGYTNGQLVYRPYWGGNKSVYMTEQMADPSYECPRLRVPETDHVLRVKVTAAVNPSLLWETDYHRLVSIYGGLSGHNNPNTVTAADVKMGVKTYLGQHQEALCRFAATKSLPELLRDPSLGAAEELNRYFRRDARSPFDILVQTTSVELPEPLLRALALKGVTKP